MPYIQMLSTKYVDQGFWTVHIEPNYIKKIGVHIKQPIKIMFFIIIFCEVGVLVILYLHIHILKSRDVERKTHTKLLQFTMYIEGNTFKKYMFIFDNKWQAQAVHRIFLVIFLDKCSTFRIIADVLLN